jgi:hypothetical protein
MSNKLARGTGGFFERTHTFDSFVVERFITAVNAATSVPRDPGVDNFTRHACRVRHVAVPGGGTRPVKKTCHHGPHLAKPYQDPASPGRPAPGFTPDTP